LWEILCTLFSVDRSTQFGFLLANGTRPPAARF
jgi:hypothetical protein